MKGQKEATPLPQLVDFRVTPQNTLILFLKTGETYSTRRIKLGTEDAGLYTWKPDGGALFAYGRRKKPRMIKTSSGNTFPFYPLIRRFKARADIALLRQLALATWGHTGESPAQEEVQALPEHDNAAD